jgi:hypothetical protein
MEDQKQSKFFSSDVGIIIYLFIAKILIHLLHPEYGIHRDEYFYIAIADQFNFQNLDMLPLTPLFLKLFTGIFGYSIKALHFTSGLLGATTLVITCLIAKELGGKRYAVLLTGIFFLFSGFIIFGAIFTYDSLDFLIWVSAIYILVRLFKEDNPRLWILLGFVLGLGLLNKMTILFFGLAIFVCLWLVPQKELFKRKWIWLAGILALLYALPFIYWQSLHNWYFLNFASTYSGGISARISFPEFVWSQIFPNNIFAVPVWFLGLSLLLFSRDWKKYRLFGFIYIFLFFLFFLVGAKFYFLTPIYAILLAVGSIKTEQWVLNKKLNKTRFIIPVSYVLLSIPFLPIAIPVLPVEQLVDYVGEMGVDVGVRTENHQLNNLPQHIADRFGWEEMVKQVADIYLSENNNKNIGIFTKNWGQACAIHYYKNQFNLPEPITEHGWYYFETLRTHEFKERYISVEFSKDELQQVFKTVEEKGIFTHPYCMPYENNKSFYLCSNPKYNLKDYWLVQRQMNPLFERILTEKGVQASIDYYYQIFATDSTVMLFTENQINSLGYEYLYGGQINDAISLFKLNVDVFPQSWNVYDSLGEGYMKNVQYELAIEYYNKSLEINPDNSNGIDMIEIINKIRPIDINN